MPKTTTFESLLTRTTTKQGLKDLIRMAKFEIEEWEKFINLCKEKLNANTK